jgi:hypothetical protein
MWWRVGGEENGMSGGVRPLNYLSVTQCVAHRARDLIGYSVAE